MDATAVAGCFRDKSILITGSTGFLGKLLVEKILRVQPAVKKLYLLVRAADAASAEQRVFSDVIEMDLFNVLRKKYGLAGFQSFIQEKVVPLAGDIIYENFGLDNSRADALSKDIDVIINGAATTNFYERYDVALASNALGPRNACEFAKKCPNLKLLLHISTAFVAGTQEGLLLEKAFQNGETLREGYYMDIEAELQLVDKIKSELTAAKSGTSEQLEKSTMKELGLKRACHFGWPNVYTFTKTMGEILLGQRRGNLPVVIIRPTMVTSTYQDPFPGWIEGARTIDALIVAYNEQAFPCFIGDRSNVIDAIPADIVINAAMVAIAVHWNEEAQVIYHVSSSLQNPLSLYAFEDACMDYFYINPRTLENGKTVPNKRPYVFKNLSFFRLVLLLVYKLPLQMLHVMSFLLCGMFSQRYNKLNRRLNFLMLLVKLYAPYAFFNGRFDDTNLSRLWSEAKMDGGDNSIFNFDPKCVDWHSYLVEVHVPAVLKCARREKGRA